MSAVRRVLLILTDQQRADLSAREGYALDPTPYMDALARRGVWFDRAYTASPLCVPARTSIVTGRYPSAHHVRSYTELTPAFFDAHLYGVCRAAGLATAMIGKNHTFVTASEVDHWFEASHDGLRSGASASPAEREFDSWLHELRHATFMEGPTPYPLERQVAVRVVDDAIRWIDSQDRWFAVVSFPEPHSPYQAPEPYYSLFPPASLPALVAGPEAIAGREFAWRYLQRIGHDAIPDYDEALRRMRSVYHGMLRMVDDQVARLIDHLERAGGLEDTLVIVTSDHGEFAGEYGLLRKGAGLPEVTTRVPLIFVGGGIRPHGQPPPHHVSTVDLLPTICAAIRAPVPYGVQGRSLWPMLTGATVPTDEFASAYAELGTGGLPYTDWDEVPDPKPGLTPRARENATFGELNAVTMSGASRMVRRGDWKLVLPVQGMPELYHLPSDPRELRNRWGQADCADVAADLCRELATWMLRTVDPLPELPAEQKPRRNPRNYSRGC